MPSPKLSVLNTDGFAGPTPGGSGGARPGVGGGGKNGECGGEKGAAEAMSKGQRSLKYIVAIRETMGKEPTDLR